MSVRDNGRQQGRMCVCVFYVCVCKAETSHMHRILISLRFWVWSPDILLLSGGGQCAMLSVRSDKRRMPLRRASFWLVIMTQEPQKDLHVEDTASMFQEEMRTMLCICKVHKIVLFKKKTHIFYAFWHLVTSSLGHKYGGASKSRVRIFKSSRFVCRCRRYKKELFAIRSNVTAQLGMHTLQCF